MAHDDWAVLQLGGVGKSSIREGAEARLARYPCYCAGLEPLARSYHQDISSMAIQVSTAQASRT